MPTLDGTRLEPLLSRALGDAGLGPESARLAAAGMVETSLRGVDSHGINLFPHYHRAARGGRLNGQPRMTTPRRSAATAVLDADHAIGHHAGTRAMELAMELAAGAGVGAVAVRDSSHFGAAAFFALPAARRGHVGFAFTNADALVRAFGARRAVFGTNPVCVTAPMAGEDPLCLDMATSRVSWNKILNCRRAGEPVPAGWAADCDGEATSDAAAAAMLEPTGEYKGYGLGMIVEVLCGLLADGPAGRELRAMYTTPLTERRRISHFFMALRVDAFVDPARFAERLRAITDDVRALPPGGVMVPGDPEKKTFALRSASGIPVDDAKWEEFLAADPRLADAVRA